MFGRATITLGIGPHSSLFFKFMAVVLTVNVNNYSVVWVKQLPVVAAKFCLCIIAGVISNICTGIVYS